MRLEIVRSFRRTLDQARFAQLLKVKLPDERRAKTLATRQPDPPGIHCAFCGELKSSLEAACPNDSTDWPHPREVV